VEAVARGGDPVAVEPGVAWCAVAARLAETGHDGAVVANGEQLPFPDRTFDLVMSVAVLEHVRRPEVYLREAFRVLRPGGHMYLSCENYLTFFEPHYQVAWLRSFPNLSHRCT
jgi:ubiquinone/menaquinone biosynthesis C-methylase UbiE